MCPVSSWRIHFAKLALAPLVLVVQSATAAPPADLTLHQPLAVGSWVGDEPISCGCASCAASGRHGGVCCTREACCPTIEEVKEEQSCWKVRCEKVCVPAIRMPWEPGGSKLTLFDWLAPHHVQCGECVAGGGCYAPGGCKCYLPKCGPVRCVNVLEEQTYEVTTCKCKWEIRRLPACCGHGDCACGSVCEESLPDTEPAAAEVLPPPLQ